MLPMPQRGQAISYQDLYNIVDNINTINTSLVATTSNSRFKGPNGDSDTKKVSQLIFSAAYQSLNNSEKITAVGQKKSFTVSFGSVNFKNPPVVTVTVQAGTSETGDNGNTPASYSATAVITKITTTDVSGYVVYNQTGVATNSLHVIAMGLPNS